MESECQDMCADTWEAWEEEGEEWNSEKGIVRQRNNGMCAGSPSATHPPIYSLGCC